MFWYAIKYWKKRGILLFDMLGGCSNTAKYGAYKIEVPILRKSKNELVRMLRQSAQYSIQKKSVILGKLAYINKRLK
jgi:hypothetical protein